MTWMERNNDYSNVNKFCYIRNMITTDTKSNREIKRRMAIRK